MNSDRPSFATTHWSKVWQASKDDSSGRNARQQLCQQYWYPLYAFLRRSGHDPHASEDLVQGFFADLLAREGLQHADPRRGRFRSFLLTACRNYAANQSRAQRTARRGGGRQLLSIDFDPERAEQRYGREPIDEETPERLFQRQWALAVIDTALDRLASEYANAGNPQWFAALRPFLAPCDEPPSTETVARQLQMTPGALRVAIHRLRRRFGEALREEVRRTVESDEELEEELRALLAAVR